MPFRRSWVTAAPFTVPLTCLLAMLAACASTTISSQRAPDFKGPLRRVAVVVYCPERPDEAGELRDGLAAELGARGLQTVASAGLDEAFKQEIAKFEPDVLLVVTAASMASGGSRFDISLYPHGQARRRVWQSTVEPGTPGAPELAELPAAVVERLAIDGML